METISIILWECIFLIAVIALSILFSRREGPKKTCNSIEHAEVPHKNDDEEDDDSIEPTTASCENDDEEYDDSVHHYSGILFETIIASIVTFVLTLIIGTTLLSEISKSTNYSSNVTMYPSEVFVNTYNFPTFVIILIIGLITKGIFFTISSD